MPVTRNSLEESICRQSVELLNTHLAASIDLKGQVKHAHWNIEGPAFYGLHTLLDLVASVVDAFTDQLAERVRVLGGAAEGTIQSATSRSFLLPYPKQVDDEAKHVFVICGALATFGESVRGAAARTAQIGDAGTADLFVEILRNIDQQLWLVGSHSPPKA
ncbi:MAG: DNA starvation/stationary phase protection protein Dps [Rhabdaerophilum sp.]|jgi:starvation-inducible DNA-binding protein